MEIKIFGKKLFEFRSGKAEVILQSATNVLQEMKVLPDFMKLGANTPRNWTVFENVLVSNSDIVKVAPKKEGAAPEKPEISPKGLYKLKLLNDQAFQINADPKYVDEQLVEFKDKLALVKSADFDMHRGVDEIASLIIRLENRKKYGTIQSMRKFYEQYPYTIPSRVDVVLKDNSHLKLDSVGQFVADMPKDATKAMKDYNEQTKELCGKSAVFYIIANKKDFEKTASRRDPILLAQSPFAHAWQILGAWDEEMLLLEQL